MLAAPFLFFIIAKSIQLERTETEICFLQDDGKRQKNVQHHAPTSRPPSCEILFVTLVRISSQP
jgi:hypothetical protein